MKKLSTILICLLFINSGCKKHFDETPASIIGTWEIASQSLTRVYSDKRPTVIIEVKREDFIYSKLEINSKDISLYSDQNNFNRLIYEVVVNEETKKQYLKTSSFIYEYYLSKNELTLVTYSSEGAESYLRTEFKFVKVNK